MRKLKIRKAFLRSFLWIIGIGSIAFLLGFTRSNQEKRPTKGVLVHIKDDHKNYFLEPDDILELLNSKARNIHGKALNDINIALLEKIVYTNPYVDRAEVYSTIDGYVNIDVWQRNPVIRIINSYNEHYYIDENGDFMPVTDKFSKSVVVANGYIFDHYTQKNIEYASYVPGEEYEKPILEQLNEVAHYLKQHSFWNSQIEQVYVNEEFELELIPRVGNHRILIGDSEDLDLKLDNLLVFYKEGITKTGWNNYSVINLKYSDQVVCTKSSN